MTTTQEQINFAQEQIKEQERRIIQLQENLVIEEMNRHTLLSLELSVEEEWDLLCENMDIAQERSGKQPARFGPWLAMLQLHGIREVEDLTRFTRGELLQLQYVGKSTVSAIETALHMIGLRLLTVGPNRPVRYAGRGFKC